MLAKLTPVDLHLIFEKSSWNNQVGTIKLDVLDSWLEIVGE